MLIELMTVGAWVFWAIGSLLRNIPAYDLIASAYVVVGLLLAVYVTVVYFRKRRQCGPLPISGDQHACAEK